VKSAAREAALKLFIEGKSIRTIASQIHVHRSSIERWSSQDHWMILRARHREKLRQQAIDQGLFAASQHRRTVGEAMLAIFTEAVAEHVAYLKGTLPKTALRYTPTQLSQLALGVTGVLSAEEQVAEMLHFEKEAALKEAAPCDDQTVDPSRIFPRAQSHDEQSSPSRCCA
jgi:hypothetical protein